MKHTAAKSDDEHLGISRMTCRSDSSSENPCQANFVGMHTATVFAGIPKLNWTYGRNYESERNQPKPKDAL